LWKSNNEFDARNEDVLDEVAAGCDRVFNSSCDHLRSRLQVFWQFASKCYRLRHNRKVVNHSGLHRYISNFYFREKQDRTSFLYASMKCLWVIKVAQIQKHYYWLGSVHCLEFALINWHDKKVIMVLVTLSCCPAMNCSCSFFYFDLMLIFPLNGVFHSFQNILSFIYM